MNINRIKGELKMNINKIKGEIAEVYKYRIELHCHSNPGSECGQASPEEVVKIYADKGYHAIVLTNHFHNCYEYIKTLPKEEVMKRYLDDYNRAVKASENLGIKVLFGIEYRFPGSDDDYLIYGADEEILSVCYDYKTENIEKFRTEVSLPKSVFVQAHPFRDGMHRAKPELLDGIEALNMHQAHNSRVGLATRYANEQGFKIVTAGSDFHEINVGYEAVAALRTKTLPNDSFELVKILKSGDYVFEIGENAIVLP